MVGLTLLCFFYHLNFISVSDQNSSVGQRDLKAQTRSCSGNRKTHNRNRVMIFFPASIQWKGQWGSWDSPKYCPAGYFVYGYNLRSENAQGGGDDTALNSIALYCRRPNSNTDFQIISHYGFWGDWGRKAYCSGGDNPVIGFDVKEEGGQGAGDDTALNAVDLYCKKGSYVSASVNTGWGSWKPAQKCPAGTAVRGIRTQIEGKQGWGDDTALNGVELYCSSFP